MIVLRPLVVLLMLLSTHPGCRLHQPPGAASSQNAVAMGSWPDWHDLAPLVEVARGHVSRNTMVALERASHLLRKQRAHAADAVLAEVADADGRHWIAVARADLAALHFETCIRGVAWRLSDSSAAKRTVDYDRTTTVEAGDISVEAMLTNLDAAMNANVAALTVQARIARARVAAYVNRCPPNPQVAELSEQRMKNDLAQLAAEGHLTPDLAYLWASVQMNEYSGAAARPFLLQAQEGGFDDPSVVYLLATIALEQRALADAEKLAREAERRYRQVNDPALEAQARFLQGEIARARKQSRIAKQHWHRALALSPKHAAATLALTQQLASENGRSAAVDYLVKRLPALVGTERLAPEQASSAAAALEAVVILVSEPELASVCREALLVDIDKDPDPTRRGIRYFYAATLDARLGDYETARGHGVLARDEFSDVGDAPPVDVDAFLKQLESAG